MLAPMRRTKIVATIGPASREPKVLEQLIAAGVDVVRLNFSHGQQASHLEVMKTVREIAERQERSVALLQDLSGPKIRTGAVEGGSVRLEEGAELTITNEATVVGSKQRISTTYAALPRDVGEGDVILLDDGKLELEVLRSSGSEVRCRVVHGGPLGSSKGMNLPGVALSTPAITEKDRSDLAFGVQNGVDYVALSFVRAAADVVECRRLVEEHGRKLPLIAKIEKREAIDDLPQIIEAADGLMVARGDLGVEMSTEEVPTLQKRMIEMANGAGKLVITATQMLERMVNEPRPTRAEASDVANAILDGTDGIMLSGETASGRYPVEAVETMARIARHTEANYDFQAPARMSGGAGTLVSRALARVAATVAEELGCELIVSFTESGATARLVSAFRPSTPVAAITYNDNAYRELALWWGVLPIKSDFVKSTDEMLAGGERLLLERGLVKKGDTVLMLGGQSHKAGATNMLRVRTID